jgi:hypothetical protein
MLFKFCQFKMRPASLLQCCSGLFQHLHPHQRVRYNSQYNCTPKDASICTHANIYTVGYTNSVTSITTDKAPQPTRAVPNALQAPEPFATGKLPHTDAQVPVRRQSCKIVCPLPGHQCTDMLPACRIICKIVSSLLHSGMTPCWPQTKLQNKGTFTMCP